jgi:hypothetical protein
MRGVNRPVRAGGACRHADAHGALTREFLMLLETVRTSAPEPTRSHTLALERDPSHVGFEAGRSTYEQLGQRGRVACRDGRRRALRLDCGVTTDSVGRPC